MSLPKTECGAVCHDSEVTDRDPAAVARAEARRRTWTFGVAHSPLEMDRADLEFWLSASPAERIRGMTELIEEMRWLEGDHGPPPRLQRLVGGVRPRGR